MAAKFMGNTHSLMAGRQASPYTSKTPLDLLNDENFGDACIVCAILVIIPFIAHVTKPDPSR